MSSKLARRFQADVSLDGVTWIPYKGIQDFAKKESPTIVSTTDFDAGGFETVEKTVTSATVTIKNRHIDTSLVEDPGQALTRAAGEFQFGDSARLYIRWYDRFNPNEKGWQMRSILDWTASKTAAADIEEITATFRGDGLVSPITNPNLAGAQAPVIAAASPSGQGSGQMVNITGAYFTGTTAAQVKFGGTAATSIDVISDSLIVAILPTAAAGSAPITVATTAGISNSLPYTRAA